MIALGLLGLVFLIVISIHTYAWVFRLRTEHLLAELKNLRLEQTPGATVLELRNRHSAHVMDKGPCSEAQCAFSVEFVEWDSIRRLAQKQTWLERPTYYLLKGLQPFGLRFNYFTAQLRIDNSKLRGVDAWFASRSYVEPGFLSNVSIEARTVGNFRHEVGWPEIYEHPNLFVDKPSMCTGCKWSVDANVTWQASPEEVERAFGFDLSCITRFRECRTPVEFFPAAVQVLNDDAAKRPANVWGDFPCDTRMAHILGRDSDVIGLVRIKKVERLDKDFTSIDYDLLKLLKGRNLQLKDVRFRTPSASATASAQSIQLGSERIVLVNELFENQSSSSGCAVMLPTPENMNAVQAGIADDRSGVLEAR